MVKNLTTEARNKNTETIDQLSTLEMVQLMNQEDKAVIEAVNSQTENIAQAIDAVVKSISKGGRLIYFGAGTSGRLGVLDASEWLPTFGVGKESVIGLIAGGDTALRNPIEGAEDFEEMGQEDLEEINLNENDIVCAIASSGRTPYCIGGLKYAKEIGANTISIANVENSLIGQHANIVIEAITGPEVITGSTRLKAGSAQKMILNIISTSSMIKYGKVYGNLMVDVIPNNEKLIDRAHFIIEEATGASLNESKEALKKANNNVKVAIIMLKLGVDIDKAHFLIKKHNGRLGDIIA